MLEIENEIDKRSGDIYDTINLEKAPPHIVNVSEKMLSPFMIL